MFKKSKNILSLTLALSVVLGATSFGSTQAFASTNTNSKVVESKNEQKLTKEELKIKLEKLGIDVLYIKDKKNNTKTQLNDEKNMKVKEYSNEDENIGKSFFKNYDTRTPIKVNSIKEIEEFIDELKSLEPNEKESEKAQNSSVTDNKDLSIKAARAAKSESVGTASKWAPLFGTFAWKNITFSFNYQYYPLAGYYIITDNIASQWMTSHLSGLTILAEWNQTGSSANLTVDHRQANLRVDGYYVLGFDFGEFEVGAHVNDTWKITSDNIDKYVK